MSNFRTACPLLLEGDVLSLSSDFTCELYTTSAWLLDTVLGARHEFLRPAVIKMLQTAPTYSQLRSYTHKKGTTPQELAETLGFINRIGALRVRRTPAAHVSAALLRVRHFIFGVAYKSVTWRWSYSALHMAMAVMRASWPVLLLVPLSFMLFVVSGLVTFWRALEFGLVFSITFAVSMLVHELTHGTIIKMHTNKVIILQSGMRMGLVHAALPPRAEVSSALAGPLTGLLAAGLVSGLFATMGAVTMALVAGMAAVSHLASFWPGYGDGATLLAVLGKKQKA